MDGFLQHYWPTAAEIPAQRVREIRVGISALLEEAGLEIDTTPGNVLGDLHVTPAAWEKAATEIAWSRFASDLHPENVRKGVAYNCDFVRGYLEAFGQDYSSPAAWGILRLTFVDDTEREIDRSTTFAIQNQEFRFKLPFPGPLYIDHQAVAGENHRNLTRIGNNRWVLDLLIQGPPSEGTVEGQTAQIDREVPGLTAANLMGPVRGGAEPTNLQDMARRLRAINTRQPSTRGGVTGMVITRFPEIESVSAVLSGDVEQVRDSLNPMLMPGGKVDLHCRGDNSVEDMMTVSLPRSGTTTPYYAGIIKFPDIPVSISHVTYNKQIVAWQLVSVASTEYPGLSGSFSKHEEFFLRVDAEGIQGKIVGDTLMADFEITWTIDPSLTAVSEWIQAEENHVAGIDLLPRWFIPYHVNHLDVWYNRKSGVVFNRLQAREELLNRFNTHHPGSPAGSHTVGDTLYWAGAHSLHRIEFEAELRPSLATYWHPGDLVHPQSDADWEAFDLELTPVPTRTVTDLVNFTPDFIDLDSGVSVAGRNFSWRLPSANLRLIERESI